MDQADILKGEYLSDYITSAWSNDHQYQGLDSVIRAISFGTNCVQQMIRSARFTGLIGTSGITNVHGEITQLLDQAASDIFIKVLSETGRVSNIGSEESENMINIDRTSQNKYIVHMDPLDGSSNIDVAVPTGSIFGIWPQTNYDAKDTRSLLRPGQEQIAAAYALYGTSTIMVVAVKNSVQGFTLDPNTQRFILTHPNLKIPKSCSYYSVNEGNFDTFTESTKHALIHLRNAYSLRYVGSLVADFHRNVLKGGIFLYPGQSTNPNGKLRFSFEASPSAFIVENAGGRASTGKERILDIVPSDIHQCVPLYIGSCADVKIAESFLKD